MAFQNLWELRRRPIVANAASLFGSTVVTAGLGFAFWAVAGRLFTAEEVGVASSAISAMQFIATAGVLGLGTLVIAEVSRSAHPQGLAAAALAVATVSSVLIAVLYVMVGPHVGVALGVLGSTWPGRLAFVLGVGLTAFTVVLDQLCIGVLRGSAQLWRNIVFAVVKLVVLPAAAMVPSVGGAAFLYTAWAAGNVVSLVTFCVHARRLGLPLAFRPAWDTLHAMKSLALAHHWLNLSASGPRTLLPVLATSMLGPKLGAGFYLAQLVVGFANIVPIHLSTTLFSIAKGELGLFATEARGTLRLAGVVGVVSAVGFAGGAHLFLAFIGPDYVHAEYALMLLGLTTLPMTVKTHYMALCRVRGDIGRCAAIVTVCGAGEVVAAALGGTMGTATAVAGMFLLALVVEALALWPTVAHSAGLTLFGTKRGRHAA